MKRAFVILLTVAFAPSAEAQFQAPLGSGAPLVQIGGGSASAPVTPCTPFAAKFNVACNAIGIAIGVPG